MAAEVLARGPGPACGAGSVSAGQAATIFPSWTMREWAEGGRIAMTADARQTAARYFDIRPPRRGRRGKRASKDSGTGKTFGIGKPRLAPSTGRHLRILPSRLFRTSLAGPKPGNGLPA